MNRSRVAWVFAAVVAVAALVYWFMRTAEDPVVTALGTVGDTVSARDTQSVTLYFGNPDGPGLTAEARAVMAGRGLEERVEYAVGELLRGPTGDLRPLFRSDAYVKGVFYGDGGDLVINFTTLPFSDEDSEIARGLAVLSLMHLLDEHFPEVRRVTLLVEGTDMADIETQLAVPSGVSPRSWLTDVRVG